MPPSDEDDWSDSDEELGSEVETSVLLGISDGPITSDNELADAAVSRIGGHPVRAVLRMYHRNRSFDYHSMYCRRLFFLPTSLLYLPPNAKSVHSLWSFWSRCGVHLRTVPWIALCMSGVARTPAVSEKMAGMCQLGEMHLVVSCYVCFSVRAWRGLRFNEKYAAKLQTQLARKREQEQTKRLGELATLGSKTNPFSVSFH